MSEANSPQTSLPPKMRQTWRLRWSLQGLAVFMALLGIPLMAVSGWLREGYIHEDVAAKLQKLGGASVDWKFVEREHVTVTTPFAYSGFREVKKTSDWLEAIGAAPVVQRIDRIGLYDQLSEQDLDAAIAEMARLGEVRILSFHEAKVTEWQLERLLDQVNTESLNLDSVKSGRGRLPFLARRDLKWLGVMRTQFSNPAIDDLPLSLEYLDATRTRINDDGLDKFLRLKNLKTLKLLRTTTTEEGIENLRRKMPWCEISWEPLLPKHMTQR